MKYLITGSTEANKTEVIAGLESLWDGNYEQNRSFELVLHATGVQNPTQRAIKEWIDQTECVHEIVPEGAKAPEDIDVVLALVGENPDSYTLSEASYWIDNGVEVRDLAGQMVELRFETEQVPQEPDDSGLDQIAPSAPTAAVDSGWPGEAPQIAQEAPEPEKSREVPAKSQEGAQADPAVILKGVEESDLERMPVPALKGLVEKLGLDVDKRSKGKMLAAVMEVVIALDKGEVQSLADSGQYDDEGDEFVNAQVEKLRPEDVEMAKAATTWAGNEMQVPVEDEPEGLVTSCGPYGPTLGGPMPADLYATSPAPASAVIMEVVYLDGTSKKKVFPAPFTVELSNIVATV